MLHRLVKNQHPCIFIILRGKQFPVSPLSVMAAVHTFNSAFYQIIVVLFFVLSLIKDFCFIMNGCWILPKHLLHILKCSCDFLFIQLMWQMTLTYTNIKLVLHLWGNTHLAMLYFFLYIYRYDLLILCLGFLQLWSWVILISSYFSCSIFSDLVSGLFEPSKKLGSVLSSYIYFLFLLFFDLHPSISLLILERGQRRESEREISMWQTSIG